VRAHLQNPARKCDFPIGYFIFLLTLEKCAILQFSVLSLSIRSKHQAAIFVSSCISFPFVFCVVSVYLLKKQFLVVKKFLYVNKMS
jgi:hypothetical protein